MIEIIVDGKTARERLFDTYILKDGCQNYFTPKNNEIRKYCKFLKSYYRNHDIKYNYFEHFFIMEIDKEEYEKVNYSVIDNDEKFLFEFSDDYPEETAFYFKLKYC